MNWEVLTMRSRASFFNGTLFKKNIRRFLPLWGLYTLALLLMLPVTTASSAVMYINNIQPDYDAFAVAALGAAHYGGMILNFFYGCGCAMAVFSYLFNSRSAGMLHALPLSRECHFVTNAASGLSFGLVPMLVAAAITVPICAANGLSLAVVFSWFGIMALSFLFFFGFAAFVAMLTGSIVILPVAYGIFNFAAVIVEGLVREVISEIVYGVSEGALMFDVLSPVVHLFGNKEVDYATGAYCSWPYLIIIAAAGLVFLAAACAAYRRRPAESAGDVVVGRKLKYVFKYCFTFACALVFGYIICIVAFGGEVGALSYGISAVIAAALGWFGAEMMLKKTVRVFKSGWKGLIVCALIIAAIVAAFEFDVFGLESWVPDAGDVESAKLYFGGGQPVESAELTEDITELHRRLIADKDEIESIFSTDGPIDAEWRRVNISYTMSSGQVRSREYTMLTDSAELADPKSPAAYVGQIALSEEFVKSKLPYESLDEVGFYYCSVYSYTEESWVCELEYAKALELYRLCREDALNGNISAQNIINLGGEFGYQVEFEISSDNGRSEMINVYVTEAMPQAYAWLRNEALG